MDARILGVGDLDDLAPTWDAAVAQTPGADPFCARSPWSFAAASHFPIAEPPVIVSGGLAHCGLRPLEQDGLRLLVGLDPVWGFATPVVGPPLEAAAVLATRLAMGPFDIAVITGQSSDGELTRLIGGHLQDRYGLFVGPTEQRLRIDLRDGFEAWLARRSPRFRQRLRRIVRDADAERISIEGLDTSAQGWFDRILTVESASWKGAEESGLASPDLAGFYREMCARLPAIGSVHAAVARRDDRDIGFILGGVIGSTYRGLQLSYAHNARDASIGHLLQHHQLRALDGTGIDTYDMGMDMEYKRRWADRVDETFALIIRND